MQTNEIMETIEDMLVGRVKGQFYKVETLEDLVQDTWEHNHAKNVEVSILVCG